MDHEADKAAAKSRQILKGHLEIDLHNGVATFMSGGFRILRITHLPDPIPPNVSIDIVAVEALTSYTPLQELSQDEVSKAMRAAVQHDLAHMLTDEEKLQAKEEAKRHD
jgi:hypothetical protein